MLKVIAEHWEAALALMALAVPTFIQVTPIRINPWTWLATAIGRAINKELGDKVDRLQLTLNGHIAADDERDANQCRMRILRFNDEILQDIRHTREHFNDILDDITAYERYCSTHPLYSNNKAGLAIENIKRVYKKCEKERSFL